MSDAHVSVLLVDERDDARTTLARRLEKDARLSLIGVVAAPEDAVQLLRVARPDAVLLDVHGLNSSGPLACMRLRRLTTAPLIVLVSFMTPELLEAVRGASAADYVLKNVDSERLTSAIIKIAAAARLSAPERSSA